MYTFIRCSNWAAAAFFIILFILGNTILLNLFLAILLKNFENDVEEEKVNEPKIGYS
jgi:hypothetical protein